MSTPDKTFPTGIEREVCDDIAERQRAGVVKYGATCADNPAHLEEWLRHAYEESLDKAIYLRRAMREVSESGLLSLVADIRAAAGDPHGRLMQDELVARIRTQCEESQSHGFLRWLLENCRIVHKGSPLTKDIEGRLRKAYEADLAKAAFPES